MCKDDDDDDNNNDNDDSMQNKSKHNSTCFRRSRQLMEIFRKGKKKITGGGKWEETSYFAVRSLLILNAYEYKVFDSNETSIKFATRETKISDGKKMPNTNCKHTLLNTNQIFTIISVWLIVHVSKNAIECNTLPTPYPDANARATITSKLENLSNDLYRTTTTTTTLADGAGAAASNGTGPTEGYLNINGNDSYGNFFQIAIYLNIRAMRSGHHRHQIRWRNE